MAFAIAVLGSWVRINGAGVSCPDWPLCHGALIPSFEGGVIFEWLHRLAVFVEAFAVLGAIVTGWRERKRIAGVTAALIALGAVFVCQVVLGGATVLLLNSPSSVVLHWAMGMALLAILTALAVLAMLTPEPGTLRALPKAFGSGAAPFLALAAGFEFITMCVGAYVSSSYAGLACTTVPGCDGSLFGHGGAQFVQMLHRLAAFSTAIVALVAVFAASRLASRRVFTFALAGIALVVLQISLGVANVVWQLPIALRELHAANAGATFVVFVVATVLAVLDPRRLPQQRGAGSREPGPTGRVAGA